MGVPKKLKKTVFPFNYGKFEQLNQIVNNNKVSLECRYNDDEKFLNYLYLDEKD